jgi:hypothetical protein
MHGDGLGFVTKNVEGDPKPQMQKQVTRRTSLSVGVSLVVLASATGASAQALPPPPPMAEPAPTSVAPAPQTPPPSVDPQRQTPPQGAPAYPPPQQQMVLLGPSRLPYTEGDPVPPGYAVETRPAMGVAKAGIATFVPLYGLSALFGASYLGSENGGAAKYGPMLIPIVGPFATIGTADTDAGTLFLVVDGLGQLAGAAMFIAGMVSEDKYLARQTTGSNLRPEVMIGPKSATLRWQF